ncbi:MAG: putative manganese-dependent inorganic diphosphatase, partial [Clostridiales Family XIII bacterium]|nr:putative manganese-dependent inorganic diphosphatase [Clostridiales Family XIII bacterium]
METQNDYDPLGGHTKDEADAAYAALFRELHGSGESVDGGAAGVGGAGATGATAREKVIVIGHKNPDTDSICAAIAYADLKGRLDPERDYIPCRAGRVSDETAFVLAHFGVPVPALAEDVKTRIEDIDFRRLPGIPPDMSLREAWDLLKERNIVTLPVTVDAEGVGDTAAARVGKRLIGLVTVKDIGKVYLDNNNPTILTEARTPVRNIARVLGGHVIVGDAERELTEGKVLIAAGGDDLFAEFVEPKDVVIVSNRDELMRIALYKNASCLVVTVGAAVSDMIRNLAREHGSVVISTEHNTFAAARLINQSIPVRFAMASEGIISFSPHTLLSDVRKVMSQKRHRDFPVLDDDGNFLGMISRRFLLDAPKRKTILVDHNERAQAVSGIDEAQILEIIDHHRLAPIETLEPVYFRNEPYGATCTIVTELYREHGLEPDAQTAGLLCSAILSDTLGLRSPTTTQADRVACATLATLAGIDIGAYTSEMFSAGAAGAMGAGSESAGADGGASPEDLLGRDFKTYQVSDKTLGISQINFMDADSVEDAVPALAEALETVRRARGADMVFALLTNIPAGDSDVLFCGEGASDLLETAFQKQPAAGRLHLRDVVSR